MLLQNEDAASIKAMISSSRQAQPVATQILSPKQTAPLTETDSDRHR